VSSALKPLGGVAAVVLAAGESARLGRPKQMLKMGGETLVERAVRVAVEAGLRPVIVVVREEGELADGMRAKGCEVVVNEGASEGMASSIRCGVERAEGTGAGGVVVMACDQVGLGAAHLRALSFDEGRVAGSAYAGKVGIPAYFPKAVFGELRALRGDVGAREMLQGAASVEDEGLAVDIDTEADVVRVVGLS
jgi:molybdenum cofactor cytidylyltransferase